MSYFQKLDSNGYMIACGLSSLLLKIEVLIFGSYQQFSIKLPLPWKVE